jgi:predicted MFS family arabinose efflux permease
VHLQTVPVALGFLASAVAMGGFLAFAVLHADHVGLERTSLPLFVYGAVVVAGRIGFARVPDRLPPLPLGSAALGVMAAGLLVATSWPTASGLLTGTALMALGVTFSTPAFFSAIFAAARPSERGAASATASMALDIGLGLGPVALGVTADRFGIPGAFAAAAGVAVLGAAWTLRLARQSATRKDPRP